MADPNGKIEFSQPMHFHSPKSAGAVWLTMSEYDTIIDRVKKSNPPPDNLNASAWACVGLAAAALLGAITFPFSVEFKTTASQNSPAVVNFPAIITETALIIGILALAIVTGVQFYLIKIWRKNRLDVQSIVIEDMEAIRERCNRPSQPQSTTA